MFFLGPNEFKTWTPHCICSQAPWPPQPWQNTLNATQDGPMCLQKNYLDFQPQIQGQEDCLYLNVYTPDVSRTACSYRIRCASCTSVFSLLERMGVWQELPWHFLQILSNVWLSLSRQFFLIFFKETHLCKIFCQVTDVTSLIFPQCSAAILQKSLYPTLLVYLDA
jgi:hypothetical protein